MSSMVWPDNRIPEKALYVLNKLKENGFESYVVGGCVRDSILGRIPGDWDITTSAKPEEVKRVFRRTIDTGIAHGTVTVMIEDEGFEVTTFRVDGAYEDHRHPDQVAFTPNLEEDLKRRDFTINAMAYSPDTGLIDLFGGMDDIREGRIRCVGDPVERFTEDALRMLRGVRFAGQLGFGIEAATVEAIRICAPTIANVSAERIREELTKLLLSGQPEKLLLAEETGLCRVFFPELSYMLHTEQNNPHHCYNVGEHSLRVVKNIQGLYPRLSKDELPYGGSFSEQKVNTIFVYAALLHDVGKPSRRQADAEGVHHFHGHAAKGTEMAEKILKRLRFDNDTIRIVTNLIRFHETRHNGGQRAMRRLIHKAGTETMPYLFLLQEADICAQSGYKREEKLAALSEAKRIFREIREKQEPVNIRDLAVTGNDIIALGVQSGPAVGKILNDLLELVMEDPAKNNRKLLLTEMEKRIKIEHEG